jgi:predicted  nucleic acid-binding Zn-ribbon protein
MEQRDNEENKAFFTPLNSANAYDLEETTLETHRAFLQRELQKVMEQSDALERHYQVLVKQRDALEQQSAALSEQFTALEKQYAAWEEQRTLLNEHYIWLERCHTELM